MTVTADRPLVLAGAGKMGSAMLTGWLARGIAPEVVVAIDPAPVADVAEACTSAGVRLVPEAPAGLAPSILVLAVKPQIIAEAMAGLAPLRRPDTIVVSVAAGISLATLEAGLGAGPVVRTIPNTPAAVGKGVTGAIANAALDEAGRAEVVRLLEAIGTVHFVDDEDLIDVVTGLAGSGPAYVFHMVEALAAAGVAAGLPMDLAMPMARQTVIGAGALLEASELPAEQLRRNVTSPNGTTQAGLEVLMAEDGLGRLMARTVAAAADRSRELGR